ncbi:MAG: AMP-binding protein [Syntrophobacteraceae bacterium]|nr:AMP-binding protein [Syntrophobacteraceae bacterium]
MGDRKSTYNADRFRTIFEREFTYLNGFLRNTHRYANRTALTCPIRAISWNYADIDKQVNKLAHALLMDGVGKSDVVMYQLFNCAEFVFLYLAPQKIGAIDCPINFRLSYGETAYTIDDSQPKVYFYDAELSDTAEKALNMAKHKPETVVMVDVKGGQRPFEGAVSYTDYVGFRPDFAPEIAEAANIYDETTRLYTSGTTGMPKGVPLNSLNEVFSAHDVIMHFPLSPRDKTMNMTPWFHRGGLYAGGPCPTLYIGGELVVLRYFDAALILDYVEKYGLTFLIGAPATLQSLHDEQLKSPRNLEKLKGIVTMGAPLERSGCIRFQKVLTPNIFNGYGSTEAFWNCFLRPDDLPEKAGSTGRACTDDDVAVVKVFPDRLAEPHEFVAKDDREIGEIIVKPTAKCSFDYFNNPDAARAKYHKGWLYVGDLGTWDEDEFVTVAGRKDDMIISGGENIQPVQVEEALNSHPKVSENLVIGMEDEQWGQIVVAYVVANDPSLTARELDRFCAGHSMLARFKRPRYYRFVEKLPMTATGKKIHYKMRAQAIEDAKSGLLEKV